MTKYDRINKRKQAREADKLEKNRIKDKGKKLKTWRKQGNNYIYKGWIKFSIGSLFVLAFVALVLVGVIYLGLAQLGIIPSANAEMDITQHAERQAELDRLEAQAEADELAAEEEALQKEIEEQEEADRLWELEQNKPDPIPNTVKYIAILTPTCVGCPTVEELMPYDTSDPRVSGTFIQNSDGTWNRSDPKYDAHWSWYYPFFNDQSIVFVDYDPSDTKYLQKITFHKLVDCCYAERLEGNTASHIEYRFTDMGCNSSVIAAKSDIDWEILLADTIQYMAADCDPESTEINTKVTVTIPRTDDNCCRSYVHNKVVDLAEYCKDKLGCVYTWNPPSWMLTVQDWYSEKRIDHDTFDRVLAWTYDNGIIKEIPPHN